MKYDHAVKYNGKYYIAGEDIPEPIEEPAQNAQEAEKPAEPVEGGEITEAEKEAPKKASKSRKKGDA